MLQNSSMTLGELLELIYEYSLSDGDGANGTAPTSEQLAAYFDRVFAGSADQQGKYQNLIAGRHDFANPNEPGGAELMLAQVQTLIDDANRSLRGLFKHERNGDGPDIPDVMNWDVSGVEDMRETFENAADFNQELRWNTSSLTNTARMFKGATSFNQAVDFDMSRVVDISGMFLAARAFNQDLHWDTGSATMMRATFKNASSFNGVVRDLDVSNVESMQSMFENASSFNQYVGSWDVSKLENAKRMFKNASDFDQSLEEWNIEKLENAENMLDGTALSVENYDSTLFGWAQLKAYESINHDVTLGAKGLVYSDATARNHLIQQYGWTIEGDSLTGHVTVGTNKTDAELLGDEYATHQQVIHGLDGRDVIQGGLGDDILVGGSGTDILFGGQGADHFVYKFANAGQDVIVDFDRGSGDVIDVSQLLIGYEADVSDLSQFISVEESDGDVTFVIDHDGSGNDDSAKVRITLRNVPYDSIDPDKFVQEMIDTDSLWVDEGPHNRLPVVGTEIADQSIDEDSGFFQFTVPADAFIDADGDTLTYSAALADGTALPDWLAFDGSTRTFSGTPPADYNGTLDVRVRARDETSAVSQVFKFTVAPVNDVPVVGSIIANQSIAEDTSFEFTIPADAFTDVDGDALTYSATLADGTALPAWLAFDSSTRTFSGTPPTDYNGTLDVRVTASDGVASVSQDFQFEVTPVNDAPVAGTIIANQSVAEDSDVFFRIPNTAFSDADGDTLTYSASLADGSALPDWLVFDSSTRYFFGTPPTDYNGTFDVRVTATDGMASDSQTFRFTVTPVNDQPVAVDDAYQTLAGAGPVALDLLGNDTDVDGDALTVLLIDGAFLTGGEQTIHVSNGTVTVDADDNIAFEPADGFLGTISLVYVISDTKGRFAEATVTIQVDRDERREAMEEILEDSNSPGGAGNANGVAVTDDQLALVADRVLQGDETYVSPMEARYQTAIAAETGFSNLPTPQEVQAIIDAENTNLNGLFLGQEANFDYLKNWNVSGVETIDSMFAVTDVNMDFGDWDISSLLSAKFAFDFSQMDAPNTDKLLAGWATLDFASGETGINSGVELGIDDLTYTDATSHHYLETVYDWKIKGGRTAYGTIVGTDASETMNNEDFKFFGSIHALGGDDVVMGSGYSHTIVGGAGDDILTGGGGEDTFVFRVYTPEEENFGSDIITDFEFGPGQGDVIEFANTEFKNFYDIILAATDTEEGVLIDVGHGDSVLLDGVTRSLLDSNDFILV